MIILICFTHLSVKFKNKMDKIVGWKDYTKQLSNKDNQFMIHILLLKTWNNMFQKKNV